MIMASARPVVIAGQGVLYAEATPALIEFAELIDAPVGTTLEGKSSFPETHPLSVGAGGSSRPEAFAAAPDCADCRRSADGMAEAVREPQYIGRLCCASQGHGRMVG
jgi:TPP-dependent 2-oxoacid decarboxylase